MLNQQLRTYDALSDKGHDNYLYQFIHSVDYRVYISAIFERSHEHFLMLVNILQNCYAHLNLVYNITFAV